MLSAILFRRCHLSRLMIRTCRNLSSGRVRERKKKLSGLQQAYGAWPIYPPPNRDTSRNCLHLAPSPPIVTARRWLRTPARGRASREDFQYRVLDPPRVGFDFIRLFLSDKISPFMTEPTTPAAHTVGKGEA